ncbi:hypothetical protein V5799_009393 [Amblyomma americanum]|uniref:DDE Tnp4 domain-containing protein n=1 Tax=Amblyomma americanum TaxID=6943 RepID=A0AAQ4FBT5_AMBAM
MKPYGRTTLSDEPRIFNYRLSRARRVVEHALGILANRFRCLQTVINAKPEKVAALISATFVMHNFLCKDGQDAVEGGCEGLGGATFGRLLPSRGRGSACGATFRDKMCAYFTGKCAVPWQRESAHVGTLYLPTGARYKGKYRTIVQLCVENMYYVPRPFALPLENQIKQAQEVEV